MKKYILKILLFFAIVAVIDLCAGSVGDYLQTHPQSGDTKKLNDLVMEDCHEVLILGSSRAHHHYDTPFLSDTLGLDVYNAGYDGNGCVFAYGVLDMIIERYRPKLVLFDVEPAFDVFVYDNDDSHKRYISLLKPYYRNTVVGEIIKDVSCEEWYKVHSGLLRYNSKLISLLANQRQGRKEKLKGYEPLHGIYEDESDNAVTHRNKIDTFKLKYIEKLLCLAKKNDIIFAVVASPKYGKTSSDDDLRLVKDICKKYDVPFLDYYAAPEFMPHREWFRESMHLNEEGARAYSEMIIDNIDKLLNNNK